MSSRGKKKKTVTSSNDKVQYQKKKNRQIWWALNKTKVITAAIMLIAIIAVITIGAITSSSKNDVSTGGQYTLMDLGSSGCDPCERLQPVLNTLRTKYKNKINVNFYDVNSSAKGGQLATKYRVTSIPTLIYLNKNGDEVYRSVGYKSQAEIEADFKRLGWI